MRSGCAMAQAQATIPPPIMARKKESFVPKAAGDAKHVAHKTRHLIGPPILRLAALIVAALIGNGDTKTGFRERSDLGSPAVPKFGKSM